MSDDEWQACTDPVAMLNHLGKSLSDHQRRHFACAWWSSIEPRGDADDDEIIAVVEAGKIYVSEKDEVIDAAWMLRDSLACCMDAFAQRHERIASQGALLIREIVGNPFRPKVIAGMQWRTAAGRRHVAREIGWITPTVDAIAGAARTARDLGHLPILADALEEAGCDAEDLLRHLRGYEVCNGESHEKYGGIYWCERCGGTEDNNPDACWMRLRNPHVLGCWALDCVLGKS